MSGLGGGGGIREKIEGSTVVDLLTVIVLVTDFMLLRKAGTQGFRSPSSITSISGDPNIIAAQLTGILLAIYITEAIVDKSSH